LAGFLGVIGHAGDGAAGADDQNFWLQGLPPAKNWLKIQVLD
jgi:hypothetical protein